MTAMKQMKLPFTDARGRFYLDADNDNGPARSDTEAKWRDFHAQNPGVYDLIELYAFKAIAAGRKHYGMQSIIEVVRWHSDIQSGPDGDGFKINNNHGPYYARLCHEQNPQYDGFFRTRTIKGE